jgi:hypothetical protein
MQSPLLMDVTKILVPSLLDAVVRPDEKAMVSASTCWYGFRNSIYGAPASVMVNLGTLPSAL